jgi:GT2 family glycosyltransferase
MDPAGVIDSAGDGYLRCGGAFKHGHGQPVSPAAETREVFGACGGAFLVRRDLFLAVGGFDESFFMVYEDVDFSYRARLRGARCLYAPRALVHHAGSASIGASSADAVFYGQRNLEWTWIKNSPATLFWRSLLSHLLYGIASAVGYARRGRFGVWCRAKGAAIAGLPRVLRERRAVQRARTADPEALWALMETDWVTIKRREKQFDFTARPTTDGG